MEREKTSMPSLEEISAIQNNIVRYQANAAQNEFIQNISISNDIIKVILDHHSSYPFRKINLTCRSVQARSVFLEILRTIGFSQIIGDVVREIIKVGEVILIFEGKLGVPKFLDPNDIWISAIPGDYGTEEHIEYQLDEEIKRLVLTTPPSERQSLLKVLDPYSIRQIEIGRPLDLTRSPYIKAMHLKRTNESNSIRGVSYFSPIMQKLMESEETKNGIKTNKIGDIANAVRKIKDIDRFVFEYAFPNNYKILEEEFQKLQDIIKDFLINKIFTNIASARDLVDGDGLILPVLQFENINLDTDPSYKQNVESIRENLLKS